MHTKQESTCEGSKLQSVVCMAITFQPIKKVLYCNKCEFLCDSWHLHHTDVMYKLQSEGQEFVVGVCSEKSIIDNLNQQTVTVTMTSF